MINFQFFPRSHGLPDEIRQIVDCFVAIDKEKSQGQHRQSNDTLALVRPHLEKCGFQVETGKRKEERIDVPVLFGENNEIDKSFFADALSKEPISKLFGSFLFLFVFFALKPFFNTSDVIFHKKYLKI